MPGVLVLPAARRRTTPDGVRVLASYHVLRTGCWRFGVNGDGILNRRQLTKTSVLLFGMFEYRRE